MTTKLPVVLRGKLNKLGIIFNNYLKGQVIQTHISHTSNWVWKKGLDTWLAILIYRQQTRYQPTQNVTESSDYNEGYWIYWVIHSAQRTVFTEKCFPSAFTIEQSSLTPFLRDVLE